MEQALHFNCVKRYEGQPHYSFVETPSSLGSPYPWGTFPGPHVPQWAHPGPP
jgi:hypothetical protein